MILTKKPLFLKTVIVASFILWATSAYSQTINIFSYGSASTRMSGDILLIAEGLIRSPEHKIQLLENQKGLAFRKNSLFIITGQTKARQILDDVVNHDRRISDTTMFFETETSIMVVSKETPEEFIELFKRSKSTSTKYHKFTRFWDDLRWGQLEAGQFSNSKYSYVDVKRPEWNVDQKWKFAFYVTYHLKMNGTKFSITVIPKEYGGTPRILTASRQLKSENQIILGTGDITPFSDDEDDEEESRAFRVLDKIGPQYVAANLSEIVAYQDTILPYYEKWNQRAPLHFISANIFIKKNEKFETLFKPYEILQYANKKIAVIGITSPKLQNTIEKKTGKMNWLKGVTIKEPTAILDKYLKELRKQVDLIILISNLTSEEYGKLQPDLDGVDISVLNHKRQLGSGAREIILENNFSTRIPRFPITELTTNSFAVQRATLKWKGLAIEIDKSLFYLDQSVNSDDSYELESFDEFSNIFSGNDVVLPDHKVLYPDRPTVSKEEFANLAAELMRQELRGEVGIFNVQEQRSDITGEQDASIIKSWIRAEEQLVVLYINGYDLKDIIERNKTSEQPNKLAISGVDKNGKVNGDSIRSNEVYRVVTTTALSENSAHYPSVENYLKKSANFIHVNDSFEEHEGGSEVILSELLTDILRRNWKLSQSLTDAEKIKKYKELYEGSVEVESSLGYWVHDFKTIAIEYSELKTTDLTAFQSVKDSRLESSSQKLFTGQFSYAALYRKKPYLSELGLRGQYGKIELNPYNSSKVESVMMDDLVYFANVGLPNYSVDFLTALGTTMGPILEVAYDTEFEKNQGQELERNIQGFLGWRFYSGSFFSSLTASLMTERRLTNQNPRNEVGANVRAEVSQPIADGKATWKSNLDFRYFFSDDVDTSSDLRSRLVWDNYMDVNIFGNFSMGPYMKYFAFTGKTFNESGYQTVMGINFNFSTIWKPKYQNEIF